MLSTYEVGLTEAQSMQAAHAGVMRNVIAIRRGYVPNFRPKRDENLWEANIEGAGAELAIAKTLDLFWDAVAENPTDLPGDVGRLQVRWTGRPEKELPLKRKDPEEALYILVTGMIPRYTIEGVMAGSRARQPQYWNERVERWLVPAADLDQFDISMAIESAR